MDFIISINSKPSVTLVFTSIETDGIYINFVGTGVLDCPQETTVNRRASAIASIELRDDRMVFVIQKTDEVT